MSCPNQVMMPFEPGKVVHFPQQDCAACPLRERCTKSKNGRSVSIHIDERLMQEVAYASIYFCRSRTTEGENIGRTFFGSYWTVAGQTWPLYWTAQKPIRFATSGCCP
jgi:hypothetical protein